MAAYKCLDPMCALTVDADNEGQTEMCPKCGLEMEEFFPEITACEVLPSESNAEHASVLARALSSKFTR